MTVHRGLEIVTTLLLLILLAPAVAGQTTAADTTATAPAAAPTVIKDVDSRQTREELQQILQRLPPAVGKVLKLDPALWNNATYLSHYPALAEFVAEHPEVAHSPNFYLERVWIPSDAPIESPSVRMWRDMAEGLMILIVIAIFTGVFVWIVRTLINHRRWGRLARVQAEVHNKLLDRFASNEDLLAYVRTTAGRRFLESAPISPEGPAAVSAPVNRILWSVQAGLVLVAAGIGLQFVSINVDKDVAPPLFAVGVLGIAVGIGFALSAIASYLLSRRLGLLTPPPSLQEAEAE